MNTANSYKARSIIQSISVCDRFIEKESPRNASLRPADVQKTLEFYVSHRAKLVAMLAELAQ